MNIISRENSDRPAAVNLPPFKKIRKQSSVFRFTPEEIQKSTQRSQCRQLSDLVRRAVVQQEQEKQAQSKNKERYRRPCRTAPARFEHRPDIYNQVRGFFDKLNSDCEEKEL